MLRSATAAVVLVLGLLAAEAAAATWEIPLAAEEYKGTPGLRRITCGVPLLPGQAKDLKELRLTVNGKPVPVQFRELARWWRADPSTGSGPAGGSLRWVLVDFAAPVGAGEKLACALTNAGPQPPAPAPAASVAEDADFITVTTGPARFVVSRKRFNFLAKAILDLNGDGRLADDEDLLASTSECGTVTEDNAGGRYFGSEGVASVEVLESGPMRVCVRARGMHPPHGGKGYAPGIYGYDVFLNFYAGSTDVFADVILTNNPPKSTGIPAMEDGSLFLKLAGGAKGCRLLGDKPVDGPLAAGESLCLYQDSNGADTWQGCSGFGKMKGDGWHKLEDQLTSFRGFKVWKRAGGGSTGLTAGKEEEVAKGDHARGTLAAWNDRGGVVVHLKHFWQQFPKAAEVAADGTVRLGLWPREWKWPHIIQDGAAKGCEIVLHFHPSANSEQAASKAPAGPYARDDAGRPDPRSVADIWDSRVMLRPTLAHMGATGALSDMGPYTPPTQGLGKKPDTRNCADGPRMLTDDKLYGNAYGWRVYGDRWRSNGGHGSLGARQPIDEDNYLYRWYLTGLKEWFAAGDARSRHFRDVRRYRIDGIDPMSYKDWNAFRAANISERDEWTRRPQPTDEEAKKYQAGLPGYSSGWAYPNPEHYTLDLLYDRYLLFGDLRSLENMRVAAAFGGYFAGRGGTALGGSWPWRANGWAARTLFRYWELTGDKTADAFLRDLIRTHSAHIGKGPLISDSPAKPNWWFTNIYCRAIAMIAVNTGDAQMLELLKTLAQGKEKDAGRVPSLFAALYHLTGEEKYREPLAEQLKGEGMLNVGGYFPASDHWLLTQPPKGKRQ